jgi:hypothetical protein
LWHPEQSQDHPLFKALIERAVGYREERR